MAFAGFEDGVGFEDDISIISSSSLVLSITIISGLLFVLNLAVEEVVSLAVEEVVSLAVEDEEDALNLFEGGEEDDPVRSITIGGLAFAVLRIFRLGAAGEKVSASVMISIF